MSLSLSRRPLPDRRPAIDRHIRVLLRTPIGPCDPELFDGRRAAELAGADHPNTEPMRASRRLVDEEPRRPVDVADDDVDIAVVVDVAERRAAADLGEGEGGASPARDVLE